MSNLYEHLRAAMEARPDASAFIDDAGRRTSYGALLEGAGRVARLLRELGLRPGDVVAVQAPKTVTTVSLYLGCLQAGAVYLPLNVAYGEHELAYFLNDARPALLVGGRDVAALPGRMALRVPAPRTMSFVDEGEGSLPSLAAQLPPDTTVTPRAAQDTAAILYTSGTTGRSKGAMLTHGNLSSNAAVLHRHWRFSADDVLLHALPIFHVHGLFVALHCAFLGACTIIFQRRFDARAVLQRLPEATVLMGVPTFYTRLLQDCDLTRERCAAMRLFIAGSAPLPAEVFNAFRERTGHRILERYGMSEAGMIASNPLDGERRAGSVGQPLPGVSLRIRGENGDFVADGEVGSIEVRGPNVFSGYREMPEQTAAAFTEDGFFITGDLGRFDDDGYLHIVGRSTDLVISGGYNVYPREVEAVLDTLDGVHESAVIGVPHADYGEAVVAAVVPAPGTCIDEAVTIAGLRPLLAAYKLPRRIVSVDALPRNAMGKVQKKALREQLAGLFSA